MARGSSATRPGEGRKPTADRLRSVELFAGAGGLALGLDRGGFRPSLVVDSDQRAIETLRDNEKRHTHGWTLETADVTDLEYAALGLDDVSLVSAGAPCQPFSIGGQLRGEGDSRNMFPEVVRAIRELRPRAFLVENVRGLLFPRARPYFDYILAQLRVPSRTRRSDEGWRAHEKALIAIPQELHEYRVEWRLLNAADFGLPQNRPRLVVVGVRVDCRASFEWPVGTHGRDELFVALHEDDYWDAHQVAAAVRKSARAALPPKPDRVAGLRRWSTVRDLMWLLGPPLDATHEDTDPAHLFVPGARLYKKHAGSRLDWPAKTVKAGVHGCPGGEHIVLLDDGSHRYFTVRECASLQGFPLDYRLPRLRSVAMRQLGNAVPVALAEALGERLAEVLNGVEA